MPGALSASLVVAVLIVVSAFLLLALRRSPGATCACFGALSDVPLPIALARNGLLLMAAAFAVMVAPAGGAAVWPTAAVFVVLLLVATSAAALLVEIRARSVLS